MFNICLVLFLTHNIIVKTEIPDIKCSNREFLCEASSRCIPLSWLCDGSRDCSDSADENHEHCDIRPANSSCFGNQPECLYGGIKRCILHEWLCDGHKDCDDGDDENGCEVIGKVLDSIQCGVAEFTCASGSCVPFDFACNGNADCMDGSDELNCEKSSKTIVEPGDHIMTFLTSNESIQVRKNVSDYNNHSDDTDLTVTPLLKTTSSGFGENKGVTTETPKTLDELLETVSEPSKNREVLENPYEKTRTSFVFTFTSTTPKFSSITSTPKFSPTSSTSSSPVTPATTTSKFVFSTRNIMLDLFPWLTTKPPPVVFTSTPRPTTLTQLPIKESTTVIPSTRFSQTTHTLLQRTPETTRSTELFLGRNISSHDYRAKVFKVYHASKTSAEEGDRIINIHNNNTSLDGIGERLSNSSDTTPTEEYENISDSTTYKKPLREIVRPVRFIKGLQKPKK